MMTHSVRVPRLKMIEMVETMIKKWEQEEVAEKKDITQNATLWRKSVIEACNNIIKQAKTGILEPTRYGITPKVEVKFPNRQITNNLIRARRDLKMLKMSNQPTIIVSDNNDWSWYL